MLIATASITSPAEADAFFDRWADMATWPEWNTDTEWVRVDGPVRTGATGRLKPKGAPAVRFTVTEFTRGAAFVDVSRLLGARLTFDHRVTVGEAGTTVDVRIDLTGPLAGLWRMVMGKGLKASAQPDLDNLRRTVESARVQR